MLNHINTSTKVEIPIKYYYDIYGAVLVHNTGSISKPNTVIHNIKILISRNIK